MSKCKKKRHPLETASVIARSALTELVRVNVIGLLADALREECAAIQEMLRERRLADGRPAVIRNGYHQERDLLTVCGSVPVRVPRLRARDGEPFTFHSELVPPYLRRCRELDEALPWLYLRGVSQGNMQETLTALLGQDVGTLSPQLISRLKKRWEREHAEWSAPPLGDMRFVYVWADAVYFRVRGAAESVCMLVVIGADDQGKKHFLAIEPDARESAHSWQRLLHQLAERGLEAPRLAVGDGAAGFWAALTKVFPKTRQQRCVVHKTRNVLNCLPKCLHAQAKNDLREIWAAPTRKQAERGARRFGKVYRDKYPKAAETVDKDLERLLVFYDFPGVHWQSIRSTNVIESAFATIRLRTRQTRGSNSVGTVTGMVYKLAMAAQRSWCRLNGFECIAQVLDFVPFWDGVQQEEEEECAQAA